MSSRDKILSVIAINQPTITPLPDLTQFDTTINGLADKFTVVLTTIGGQVIQVRAYNEIADLIANQHGSDKRVFTRIPELSALHTKSTLAAGETHGLHDVEAAILKARFGVAENGAVWITAEEMGERVVPFITQHLAIIIDAKAIVPTMHAAYKLIGNTAYGYGTFIAGPSKTADIEQSLVIGAHGPRSMTVFMLVK
jgi:L-lactate dehydrogenase complex protein LldG